MTGDHSFKEAVDRLIDGGPAHPSWGGPPRAIPPPAVPPHHLRNPTPPRRGWSDLAAISRRRRALRTLARITQRGPR